MRPSRTRGTADDARYITETARPHGPARLGVIGFAAAAVVITLLVALGGAAGSVGRYWLGLCALPLDRSLPCGTILINISGSFAIGCFGALTSAHGRYPAPETARLFFMVGVCGGFTTFSSFSLQTLTLLRAGATGRALLNVALSVLLCLAAVALGQVVGSWLSGGTPAIAQTEAEEETG